MRCQKIILTFTQEELKELEKIASSTFYYQDLSIKMKALLFDYKNLQTENLILSSRYELLDKKYKQLHFFIESLKSIIPREI